MHFLSHDSSILNLTARKRPAASFAMVVVAAALLCLIAAQSWYAWTARRDRLREASAATFNMAKALAAQGESSIRIVDAVLAGVVERAEGDGGGAAALTRLDAYLRLSVQELPELHGLFVYGADGSWLATSVQRPRRQDNSDREYFRFHAANRDRGAHVGPPIRSRSSGVWVVPVSRRLEHPDGSFAGVVVGTIEVDFFARLYDGFDVGPRGTILLALDNGTLIYRRPYSESLPGTDVSRGPVYQLYKSNGASGTAMLTARIDNVERLYSYRRLHAFPLIVACGQAKSEILGEWYQSVITVSAVSVMAIFFLGFLGLRLVRQIVIRDRLEAELLLAQGALEEQNRQRAALAQNDGLTGIANRRHFELVLAQELSRAERTGAALSLILLDVDFFKKYNDRYGHVAGDACLRQVAGALAAAVARPGDVPARYGGEEFAGILPDTRERGARMVAERIRSMVEDLHIEHADSPTGCVTVSVGVCTILRHPGDGLDSATLVKRVDALLYQAKHEGRNRVVAAGAARADAAA